MKYSNALQLAFLACWTRKNESFNPNLFGVRHVKNSRSTFAVQQATQGDEDQSSSAPHPPENPPPDELLEKGIHFASLVRDSSEESTTILNGDNETAKLEEEARLAVIAAKEADEEEARRAEEVRLAQEALLAEEARVTEEERLGEEGRLKEKLRQEGEKGSQVEETDAENTVYETKPLISPEDAERAQEIANEATQKILNDFVKPMFEQEVVRGVPEDTIKGAALAAAALVAVASKGVVVTSAAGLSAAYIAISQGVAGDIFRTVGSFAWDATEAAATIYQKLTANKNLAGMSEEFASKVMNAVQNTQKKASQLQEVSKSSGSNIKDNINTADVKEAETAFFDSQEELARVLLEAETAIDAADAAIAKADALGDDGDNEKVQTLDDETAQLEKEARLAEIAAKEAEARLAEEAQVAEEERLVEKKGLKEELRRAEELVRQDKESAADESEDEWEAAVEMSQQGLEGKIVGIDEVITDDDAKAEWDAAGKLAEELQNGVGEDFDDDDDDEMDLAALGKAAREAVEAFEEEMETIEASKKAVRDSWTAEMMSATETTDSDIEAANDMLPDGDGEDIARAAREAVKLMGGDGESYVDEEESFEGFEFSPGQSGETAIAPSPQLRDWAKLTVANLKVELRNRGLKAYGKKVEMVALLERYDLEQLGGVPGGDDDKSEFDTSSLDMMGFETEDFDFEELGRQARAAVEASSTAAESDSSSDDWFFGEDSVDMDALGAQARAAVDANFADEPSDEALQQLESEEITRFEEPSARSSKDWSKMTVIQLKNELRSRGLRVSGKKDELIERLQSS